MPGLRERVANWISGGDYAAATGYLRETADYLLDRAKEDAAWSRLTPEKNQDAYADPATVRSTARWMFNGGDPFVKSAVLLKTAFAFGQGIDGPQCDADDPGKEVLDAFWNDRRNQSAMFSTPAQIRRSCQLLLDGDLYLLVYPAQDPVQVRRLGPSLVDGIITDPEDASRTLYYRVERPAVEWNEQAGAFMETGRKERHYYRDIYNDGTVADPLEGKVQADPDAVCLHIPLWSITDGGRGTSDLAASIRWFLASKRIAEDQATISRATAALMIMLEVQGSESGMQALASRLRPASNETGDEARHHTPPLPGSVNMSNSAVQWKLNRASTDAGDARTNSRLMRMPAAAGVGLNLHYLADPENANLATSTSMELPVMKLMQLYQSIWVSTYQALCDFALEQAGVTDSKYDIPVPRMIDDEVGLVAAAVLDAFDAGRLTEEQASSRLLTLLGFDNVAEEVAKVMEASEALAAKPAPVLPPVFPPGVNGQGGQPGQGGAADFSQQPGVVEAMRDLLAAEAEEARL